MADASKLGNGINNTEELPQDFEPGHSADAMLLPSNSYEEADQMSLVESFEERRRPSNIVEIEKIVTKLEQCSIPDREILTSDETTVDEACTEEARQIPPMGILLSEEDVQSEEWKSHKNHVFILSEAGKPIYSRYGNEDKLVTLMGVIQALVSVVQGKGDLIRSFIAGQHKFVFLVRQPLILVSVSTTKASMAQLHAQLTYVYNQLLSVLTLTKLKGIFDKRHNYDLRRLLGGSEKFLHNLIDDMRFEPSFLLSSVRCLPIEGNMREIIGQAVVQGCNKEKNLVFGILIADCQLVTMIRMRHYSLYPADLHLLINLVTSSESFKTAESWTPICLPKFDASGFLYAHISYIDPEYNICLILLTVDRDLFFPLQKCHHSIVEKLKKHQCIEAIQRSITSKGYSVEEVNYPELRHFLYKSRSTAQYTSPKIAAPYLAKDDWEHLFGLYQYLHHRMFTLTRPLKTLYFSGNNETIVGWHTSGFELYATFDPLVTKTNANTAMMIIVQWIKKEEDKLFIMKSPTL